MYGTPSQGGGANVFQLGQSGLSVQAQRGTKELDIHRTTPAGPRPASVEKDSWTVFVYLCGSDLESKAGAATQDLSEMVGARGSDKVRFIVETGGAKRWRSNIGGNELRRYVIQDGSIMEVERKQRASMGLADTLADFLQWGLRSYPAEHIGLILWDHGGGSISGVCFDEVNGNDSLMLRELDAGLAKANPILWQKLDFVGFDACLMGTLETANVLASYADYMFASQEIEPGSGWEYSSIIEHLAARPDTSTEELGRALADGYRDSLPSSSRSSATLSVVDLSQVDELMQAFYRYSQELYDVSADQQTLATISRGVRQADCFGSNSWLEGFSNMVDLGGIVRASGGATPSAQDVLSALERAVTYQVRGRAHAGASGLSVYYPLSVGGSQELTAFESVALNPSYLSYVDRLAHGATYSAGQQYQSYSNDYWYDDSGLWEMLLDESTLELVFGWRSAPRWEYVDAHEGASELVSFAVEPAVDEQGVYRMQFDEEGVANVASASGLVYQELPEGQRALGETFDVYADWDQGVVEDGFDGRWLALPDGQPLCLYVVEATEDYAVFTSPVEVNGEDRYLRLHQDLATGAVEVEGTWQGTGAGGSVDRGSQALAEGDTLVPQYGEGREAAGAAFSVPAGGLVVDYGALPTGSYRYAFNIVDVFGDRLITDQVRLDIEEDAIYFVE